jgi:hypothetical protein
MNRATLPSAQVKGRCTNMWSVKAFSATFARSAATSCARGGGGMCSSRSTYGTVKYLQGHHRKHGQVAGHKDFALDHDGTSS